MKMIIPFSSSGYNINMTSYDALYGPWNSFKEMVETISGQSQTEETLERYINIIPIGLTVGIIEDDKVVEYWNPVKGEGFVQKTKDIYSILNDLNNRLKDIEETDIVISKSLCDLNERIKNIESNI